MIQEGAYPNAVEHHAAQDMFIFVSSNTYASFLDIAPFCVAGRMKNWTEGPVDEIMNGQLANKLRDEKMDLIKRITPRWLYSFYPHLKAKKENRIVWDICHSKMTILSSLFCPEEPIF